MSPDFTVLFDSDTKEHLAKLGGVLVGIADENWNKALFTIEHQIVDTMKDVEAGKIDAAHGLKTLLHLTREFQRAKFK